MELDDVVAVPAGVYTLGEPGEEREAPLPGVLLGRFPVTNAQLASFADDTRWPLDPAMERRLLAAPLADHPATGITYAAADAYCAWASTRLRRRVRLPRGAEWEAAARGPDARPWPWGASFDPDRCACVEGGAWTTAPVDAHPGGAAPCGAQQLAGNVWEWVEDDPAGDGWRAVRGGSYLDHGWGLRASRVLAADPGRATHTTGVRVVIELDPPDHPEEEVP
jgi:formylglycine-generating enzyme required for sulfatase activity